MRLLQVQTDCRSEKKAREALSRALAASQREAAANADAANADNYMNDAYMEGDDFSDSGDQLSGASEQTVTAEVGPPADCVLRGAALAASASHGCLSIISFCTLAFRGNSCHRLYIVST